MSDMQMTLTVQITAWAEATDIKDLLVFCFGMV
jgi:hypothetical protein